MKAADILENEKVSVVNLYNGERFETYVITRSDLQMASVSTGPR